jgi:hypothetical protein
MSVLNYLDVVEEYKELMRSLNEIIKNSGYEPSVLANKLKMSRAEFYSKRKSLSFSVPEVEKILDIMELNDSEDELMEELKGIEEKEVLYDAKTVKEMFNLR